MNQNLQNILELQAALVELREAEQRLHGIPDWMRELHDEHTARRGEIEALEGTAEEAARQRRAAEAAVQDAQEKLKKYQQQINKVSNQREYGAILQEIDTAKASVKGLEEQGLQALDRETKAQSDLADQHEAFRELLDTMHLSRIKRLLHAGFTPDQAETISALHTPNFM